MNPKSKRRIKLLLSVLVIAVVALMVVMYIIPPPNPYTLQIYKTDEYYHRIFSIRQSNGKYAPMADVYWLQDKMLSNDDVIKILEKGSNGLGWTVTTDNADYTRWRRSDNRVEATHRKKDGRLVIYRRGFAEWKNKYGEKNRELILKIME